MTRALLLLCLLVGVAGGLGAVVLTRLAWPVPQLFVLRIDELVAEHVQYVAERDLGDHAQRQAAREFAATLEHELDRLAGPGVTIVTGGAVLRGGVDVTDRIRARLLEVME